MDKTRRGGGGGGGVSLLASDFTSLEVRKNLDGDKGGGGSDAEEEGCMPRSWGRTICK